MKRYIGAVALLIGVVVLTVAGTAGAGPQVTSPVKGSFKYCSDPTFPPMELETSAGRPIGFDVDLANAIARYWKVKANFVKTGFTGLLPGLGSKRCNMVISGLFVTPDRTKTFPAVGYMRSHRSLLVQAGNPKRINGPNALSGKTVAVQAGTKYEEYLKSLNEQFKSAGRPQFTLQSYPGDTDAVAQLLIGRADAVMTQDTSSAFQKKANPRKLAIAYLFPEKDTFGIYYRKADKKLGTGVRAAVRALKKNGTLKRIATKWQIPVTNVK
jgi:polar amino acid transport system substrate-binding protein